MALASFRFGGEELETLPEIRLSHIVAPGLFAEIGIAGTPLSLGMGAQIGPRLREIKTMEENEIEDWYWRFGASLKVDIPLLSLYASPSKGQA
ncbi:MAG: hypothetical protein IPG32_16790, partial [Saprospirales bacterium]|nr:hypothetical protein [Saprospirales bacterium]